MFEYLERLRSKSETERQRIAFGTAAGFTAVVTAGWLAVIVSSGILTLSSPGAAVASDSAATPSYAPPQSPISSMLGAASAALGASSSPATIVVETQASTTVDQSPANQTVIPF